MERAHVVGARRRPFLEFSNVTLLTAIKFKKNFLDRDPCKAYVL